MEYWPEIFTLSLMIIKSIHSWKLQRGGSRYQMGKVMSFISSQVGRDQALCLQDLGISREAVQCICRTQAPTRTWSADVEPQNRVGAFLMLGKGWNALKGGNQGDGSFV